VVGEFFLDPILRKFSRELELLLGGLFLEGGLLNLGRQFRKRNGGAGGEVDQSLFLRLELGQLSSIGFVLFH
jgi:hypothetical protein